MTALFFLSVVLNVALVLYVVRVQQGSFGVMGSQAGRFVLRVLEALGVPVAIIAIDIRKVHELVVVLGYSETTHFVHSFVKMKYGKRDFIFQYGGDEFVVFSLFPKQQTAVAMVERMLTYMAAISDRMSADQRTRLLDLTGGLVGQLCASVVWVPSTRRAYTSAAIAMDECNNQKVGRITGERATSGRVGTLVNELVVAA